MRYDVLLCDADNTLFDFDKAEELAFYEACRVNGFEADAALLEGYSRINQSLWRLFEQGGITQPELRVRRFRDFFSQEHISADPEKMSVDFMEALGRQGVMIEGALEAVGRWREMVLVVIVTNGISRVQRGRMARSPLGSLISGLVISEEVGAAKPDPKMIYEGMRLAGVSDKRRVLVVGDSLSSDLSAAANAGVDGCWYNPNGKPNTAGVPVTKEITALDEVDALLKGE